jgi:glutaminyl-tRNA synthetase
VETTDSPDGRKVKSTIHWVSAAHAQGAEVQLYDHLFNKEDSEDVPDGADWKDNLNPNSLQVIANAKLEPSLANANPGDKFQFERLGYFASMPTSNRASRCSTGRCR